MEAQFDNGNALLTPNQAIDYYFGKLRAQVSDLLFNESRFRETIEKLTTELKVFKIAYNSKEKDAHDLEEKLKILRQNSERERNDLESQLKGSRVICLIDGDGAIFSNQLIAQGPVGGHLAAQKLSDSVGHYLNANHAITQFQLWVYVFYNKKGLVDTFGRAGLLNARKNFEDFVLGFNQATERFLMVDVGGGKEAADAKVKVHLEDNVRLPQTLKVLFGGCHDNGYVTTLRSQITAGFHNKLILLRGYADMAAGIEELGLPSMIVPDLFMPQKIVATQSLFASPGLGQSNAIKPPNVPPGLYAPSSPPGLGLNAAPTTPATSAMSRPAPPTYSSAVKTAPQVRTSTPELDSGSTTSSDMSDGPVSDPRSSPTFTRHRYINPNLPLSKQTPPPCTLFYLASCRHGSDCKYGHDYLLESEHYETMRQNAKKAPCPAINKGEICTWAEQCCYGHVCPSSPNCFYYKQGRCKFLGVDMHKDD